MKAIKPNKSSTPIFTDDPELVARARRLNWIISEKRTEQKRLHAFLMKRLKPVRTTTGKSPAQRKQKRKGSDEKDQASQKSENGPDC